LIVFLVLELTPLRPATLPSARSTITKSSSARRPTGRARGSTTETDTAYSEVARCADKFCTFRWASRSYGAIAGRGRSWSRSSGSGGIVSGPGDDILPAFEAAFAETTPGGGRDVGAGLARRWAWGDGGYFFEGIGGASCACGAGGWSGLDGFS